MSTLSHPLTYADLERERETRDERLELIEGEIVVTPSPTPFHQLISFRLADTIGRTVVTAGLGLVLTAPLDVYFDESNVLQPDLIVLLNDRLRLFGHTNIGGAPNLAVEILSPSTSARDRGVKRGLYVRFGVEEFWMVDPDAEFVMICGDPHNGQYRQAETHRVTANSRVIPAVSIDVRALFAPVRSN